MHRALLLLESITNIVQSNASTPGFLYTCLLINRLFFHETCRFLWYECGSPCHSGHATPYILHLAKIFRKSPKRAQIYASYIHVLMFGDILGFGNSLFEREENAVNEGMFHHDLEKIEFPVLEEVSFYPSFGKKIWHTGDTVKHFAQPHLKSFMLLEGVDCSDNLLDALWQNCPNLRSVTLKPALNPTKDKGRRRAPYARIIKRISAVISSRGLETTRKPEESVRITKDGLAHFLEKSNLEYLVLRSSQNAFDGMSGRAFQAISRHKSLELLRVPVIKDTWLQSLSHGDVHEDILPKLRHLYAAISAKGLEDLHTIAPNLVTLALHNEHLPSDGILSRASAFASLKDLTIKFGPNSCVHGHDLAHLAHSCSNLTVLSLAEDQETLLCSLGVTDALIDDIARHLPHLKTVCLPFTSTNTTSSSTLTGHSILSLSHNCKDLEQLTLFCHPNWRMIVDDSEGVLFPQLWFLKSIGPRGRDDIAGVEEDVNSLARLFANKTPNLTSLSIEDPLDMESVFEEMVAEIVNERD